jgi:hypothetical protein
MLNLNWIPLRIKQELGQRSRAAVSTPLPNSAKDSGDYLSSEGKAQTLSSDHPLKTETEKKSMVVQTKIQVTSALSNSQHW